VSLNIFKTFICIDLDPYHEEEGPQNYMGEDMSINCANNDYMFGKIWAGFMVIVYPFGIPLLYFLLLWYCRKEIRLRGELQSLQKSVNIHPSKRSILENSKKRLKHSHLSSHRVRDRIKDSLSFIFIPYSPDFWYWEICEVVRRLMLMAVVPAVFYNQPAQYPVTIILCMVYIKLYNYFNPYDENSENIMAEVGQYQLLITFIIASSLFFHSFDNHEYIYNNLDKILIGINLLVAVFAFYFGNFISHHFNMNSFSFE
jgi:hypothetical protein